MEAAIHRNHYVPVWYQKGFIVGPQNAIHRLDLSPSEYLLPSGRTVVAPHISTRPPDAFFWAADLYSTRFGSQTVDDIERHLFGMIDNDGATAVRSFANHDPVLMHKYFERFFGYLNAQKLRTPKGLDWIKSRYPSLTQANLMLELQHLRRMHCTMWYESVREIVSAEDSDIKFIVSDHPVITFNAALPPDSGDYNYPNDPDIRLKGTQTIFALDGDHCLILTNLEFAKDPDGVDPRSPRRNARFGGQTITRTDALIRTRRFSRGEVASLNLLLKSRAKRYVAAGDREWLYPEKIGDLKVLRDALLPPSSELWPFGGEILIGLKDGSARYQDAFGHTSKAQDAFRKKKPLPTPARSEPCGCQSGRKYRDCCEGVSPTLRAPWDVYGIRERNIMFANAVVDILGFKKGRTWENVRRDLSDEQVKDIHETLGALWPPETNVTQLLPRPDKRTMRAVYMGMVDPRTVLANVIGSLSYFDEVVLTNPFPNPAFIRPEFSPVSSPAKHRSQTIKNVHLLLTLMPFINEGIVHLVPDPGDLNDEFGRTAMRMAETRAAGLTLAPEDRAMARRLGRDDLRRTLARLPEASLRHQLRKADPGADPAVIEIAMRHIQDEHSLDPLGLLQPLKPGDDGSEFSILRGMSLEVALFLAQQTGSAIFTDSGTSWIQLERHAIADGRTPDPRWSALTQTVSSLELYASESADLTLEIRTSGKGARIRKLFRRARDAALQFTGDAIPTVAQELADRFRSAASATRMAWHDCASTIAPTRTFEWRIEMLIPNGGFFMNTAHRLLVLYGREPYEPSVPVAFRIKPAALNDD